MLLAFPAAGAEAAENLLRAATMRGEGVLGDVGLLTSLDPVPEGEQVSPRNSVLLLDGRSTVSADLGGAMAVAGLLVQAHHAAAFLVEGSADGRAWQSLWAVPPIYVGEGYPPMGLRTRTVVLARPATVRFLRIRGIPPAVSAAPPMAVARMAVLFSIPEGWPPEPAYVLPNAKPPLFPSIDFSLDRRLKFALSAIALLLIGWSAGARWRGETAAWRAVRRTLLKVMLLAACVAWPTFLNFHFVAAYHMHEQVHYYLGSKYFAELGYDGLYDAVAAADVTDGLSTQVSARSMRDLREKGIVPAGEVLTRLPAIVSRFSPSRWGEFRADVRWFRTHHLSESAWDAVWLDHGFNATPVWAIAGSSITNLVPPSHRSLTILSTVDLVLIAASFGLLLAGFGLEASFAVIVFFCLNGVATFGFTGGSLLRYDWWFLLVLGLWGMTRGRDALAGASLTAAALLRIFPVAAIIGALVPVIAESMAARSLAPIWRRRRFLAGAAIAGVTLVPLSLMVTGRPGGWAEFIGNSRAHLAQVGVSNFMGLATIPGIGWWAPALAVPALLLMAYGARRLRMAEAALVGICAIPLVFVLSNYYLIILALTGLLWSLVPEAAVSLALLGCVSWIPAFVTDDLASRYLLLTLMSVCHALVLITVMAVRKRGRACSGPGSPLLSSKDN